MGIDPSEGVRPALLGLIALVVFVLVLGVARVFQWTFRFLSARLRRFVPHRISQVVGVVLAAWLFWAVVDGVLIQFVIRHVGRVLPATGCSHPARHPRSHPP
jgi:uncharacterized membrane protein